MGSILKNLLAMSLSGSIVILLVLALRLALKKAPARLVCLLWVLVGLRLLIPFRIESNLSLQPSFEAVTPAPTVVVQPQQTPGQEDAMAAMRAELEALRAQLAAQKQDESQGDAQACYFDGGV